mmetsp:Transcript_2644/g.2771  ORF Transcript_2644/g.2771 Transcript_2644/m.2771 type:complete len:325 (-) Transcript_2644:367-1341(-)
MYDLFQKNANKLETVLKTLGSLPNTVLRRRRNTDDSEESVNQSTDCSNTLNKLQSSGATKRARNYYGEITHTSTEVEETKSRNGDLGDLGDQNESADEDSDITIMRHSKKRKVEGDTTNDQTDLTKGASASTAADSLIKLEQLLCPICLEMMVNPVTTFCGHSFCEFCIFESLIFKSYCPVCREDIRGYKNPRCILLSQLIETLLTNEEHLGEKQEYHRRKQVHTKWINGRKLVDIEVGAKVDVCDTEHIWCTGVVKLKVERPSRVPRLLIHYEGWNRLYDEFLSQDSQRLAPHGIFTTRSDIPKYQRSSHPDSLFGYVTNSGH